MSIVVNDEVVKVRSRRNSIRSSGSFGKQNNPVPAAYNINRELIEQAIEEASETVEELEQVKIDSNPVIKNYKIVCYISICIYAVICVEGVIMNTLDIVQSM